MRPGGIARRYLGLLWGTAQAPCWLALGVEAVGVRPPEQSGPCLPHLELTVIQGPGDSDNAPPASPTLGCASCQRRIGSRTREGDSHLEWERSCGCYQQVCPARTLLAVHAHGVHLLMAIVLQHGFIPRSSGLILQVHRLCGS